MYIDYNPILRLSDEDEATTKNMIKLLGEVYDIMNEHKTTKAQNINGHDIFKSDLETAIIILDGILN